MIYALAQINALSANNFGLKKQNLPIFLLFECMLGTLTRVFKRVQLAHHSRPNFGLVLQILENTTSNTQIT